MSSTNGRIIHGDARVALDLIPDESVDLVVTSPPYNAGIEYDEHDDRLPVHEYEALLEEVVARSWAKLVPGGRFALNVQHTVGRSPAIPVGSVAERILLAQPGAAYRGAIVWHQAGSGSATAWGSFASPSNPVLRGEYEMVYVAGRGLAREDRSGPGDISNFDFTAATRDVWIIPAAQRKEGHPAPFPLELVKRLVQMLTWPGDHVLDPFAGSGTTGLVAESLGRSWTCIDISRAYCEITARRTAVWEGQELLVEEV